MERITLTIDTIETAAKRAVEVLRNGGVVLYPTDTLYGLGADALSDEAVAKVYAIKGRDEKKPMHAVVADMAMMERYAEMNNTAERLAAKFLPGPLTLVLKKKQGIATGIAKGIETIGFRIPADDFCIAFARNFDGPITTTSANRAGEATLTGVDAILEQLGESAQYISLIVDAGALPITAPSTVVDATGDIPALLRAGAISEALVEAA